MFQVTPHSFVRWWSQNIFPVAGNSDLANAQAELDVFSQWCIDSGMLLNLGKCESMSFTRSRFTRHFEYESSGHRLDSVDSICDLGVVLDSKLNFTLHIDSLVVKAYRMLGYMRIIGKEFSILWKRCIIHSFDLFCLCWG
jgi:hypothetical protein